MNVDSFIFRQAIKQKLSNKCNNLNIYLYKNNVKHLKYKKKLLINPYAL